MNIKKDCFVIKSNSPDLKWIALFEDYKNTGYMYLCSTNQTGYVIAVIDILWIYNQLSESIKLCSNVKVIWSDSSLKVKLTVDDECWGIIDILNKRKMSAVREQKKIIGINNKFWENGIPLAYGEPLRI